MKTAFITLGCKVNQAESEALASYAETHCDAAFTGDATTSICIVNTCCVTTKAAMQSRQAIRKAIRNHPAATIVVTGCYAQVQPDEIFSIQGVDYIIGQSDKHRIFDIIDAAPGKKSVSPLVMNESISEKRIFDRMPAPAFGSRTRPFLKIQDGCNSFCTYCIVPYSRGRSRSLPPDQVIAELDWLIQKGAKEIVLTGIHLGRWGTDISGGSDLLWLLETIQHRPGLQRLRLSSLEPTEISDPLLDFISRSPKICRHFHVPLQSGDPEILKRMNRHYPPANFAETIWKIHERMEDAAIGADVMVGFPGETDAAFTNTRDLIASLPISYLHVFPFSPRPPAPAADYPDQVPPQIARKRADILSALGKSKKACFYKKMTGETLDVIIEKKIDKPGFFYKGLSSNYIPVYIQNDIQIETNHMASCLITDVDEYLCVSAMLQSSRTEKRESAIPDCPLTDINRTTS